MVLSFVAGAGVFFLGMIAGFVLAVAIVATKRGEE